MSWRFAHPWLLLLLLLPLALAVWRARRGGVAFGPYVLLLASVPRARGPTIWRAMMVLGLAALVVAAARPQWGQVHQRQEAQGRDLVLVIDLSLSMVTDDMILDGERVDRLRAVVDAAERFIAGRPNDRIGLVFFAEHAQTSSPVTFDHDTLRAFLTRTEERQRARWRRGMPSLLRGHGGSVGVLGDGTNLGLGLGTALRRLSDLNSRGGRAIILITDGRDTQQLRNWVDPLQGARHAAELGVRLYGIGVGDPDGRMTDWHARFLGGSERLLSVERFSRANRTELMPDMRRLRAIVEPADGVALHATDTDELQAIFDRIDRLEPSPHEVALIHDYRDRYRWPLAVGLALLACAFLAEPRLRGPL